MMKSTMMKSPIKYQNSQRKDKDEDDKYAGIDEVYQTLGEEGLYPASIQI